MTSYRFLTGLCICFASHISYGQDTIYARQVIRQLCDQNMHGRGFVRHGDQKAAEYIRHEFEKDHLLPLNHDFFQNFTVSINTFPAEMKVTVNSTELVPGLDFIIDPASPGLKGSFVPLCLSASAILKGLPDTVLNHAENKVVVADARDLDLEDSQLKRKWNEWKKTMQRNNPLGLKGLIEITDEKLVFGSAERISLIPFIQVKGNSIQAPVSSLDIHIKNKYIEEYRTRNVMGYIAGTSGSDSFLVFTAHYDHLGMMGKNCFFPGANDNASGIAMMLGLARYYSSHPQKFSVLFIGFSGEEAGLLGSAFFVNHPVMDLLKIKFLINLDLVGTGVEGITVVNGTEFPKQFETLGQLNQTGQYLVNIKKRGPACNSDHCPFFSKGVPCFFIYTLGGISAYHNTDDRPETLPLTAFEGLTRLLIEFGKKLP